MGHRREETSSTVLVHAKIFPKHNNQLKISFKDQDLGIIVTDERV